MEKQQIFIEVKEILTNQYGLDEKIVVDDMPLTEDVTEMDSLDNVEFIMEIEKRFNITVPDEDVEQEKFKTVAQLVDYIFEKVKVVEG